MSVQFDRYASVDVAVPGKPAALRITGVRIVFKVKKVMGKTMNSAEIRMYNLSPESKNAFSEIGAAVLLRAGYLQGAGIPDVFVGLVRNIASVRDGADIVTIVDADDGAGALINRSVTGTFTAGASAVNALKHVAKSTGIPIKFMATVPDKPFLTGWQYAGAPAAALSTLCARLGLEWSIQDGALVLVKAGGVAASSAAAAQQLAALISPETGLVGSLEKQALRKQVPGAPATPAAQKRYGWQGKCLLNGVLAPGDPVALEAASLPRRTIFRLEQVEHVGDTHGHDWTTEFLTTETALA